MLRLIILFLFINSLVLSAQDGQTFTNAKGHFQVKFTSKPVEQINTMPTDAGEIDLYMYIAGDDSKSFIVGYNDYPISYARNINSDTLYKNALNSALKNVNGVLIKKKTVIRDSIPGIQFEAEALGGKGLFKAHYYKIKNRLYQVVGLATYDSYNEKEMNDFFGSFHFDSLAIYNNLENALIQLGYSYDIDDDGQYNFVMEFDDGRNQLLYITPTMLEVSPREYYDVWSPVIKYNKDLEGTVTNVLLRSNGQMEIGSFQSIAVADSSSLLVLGQKVENRVSPETLEKIIIRIASIADNEEMELSSEDKY